MIASLKARWSRMGGLGWPRWLVACGCLGGWLGLGGLAAQADPVWVKKVVHWYALTSANDYPERDPQDWRLLASNDGGTTWTTLDVRTNEVFAERRQRKLYQTANATAFEMYRLQIDRVRNPATAFAVQLAGLELMGLTEEDHGPEPALSDLITVQGENAPVEPAASLFDGRNDTKWLDFSTNPQTRASWVQWRYAVPVKKVIHQYALTSANDFPQRDPQDWRLLASNDRGATWTTLDVRTNEVFPIRQQRQLYETTNAAAFEMYRLQIDKVHDPGAANAVQLAELELLGLTVEDHAPEPVFTDVISARGDNPSVEAVAFLFDGRVETKWLDFSSNQLNRASWVQWQYAAPATTVVTNLSQLQGLRARAGDGYTVKLAAVVVGPVDQGKRLSFMDATGCLELGGIEGTESLEAGQTVLITGISTWTGQQVALKEARARPPNPVAAAKSGRLTPESPPNPEENLKWMEIEGEIHYPHWTDSEFSFDLLNETQNLRVHLRCPEPAFSRLPAGTRVSVRGLGSGAFNESGQWVVGDLWAAGGESLSRLDPQIRNPMPVTQPRPAQPVAMPSTTLTKIEQIHQLTAGQIQNRPHVKIRGVITGLLGEFIQDDTAGIEIDLPAAESRKLNALGTYIEVEGSAELTEFGIPMIAGDHVVVLGRGKLPPPQRQTLSQLMTGHVDALWVEVEGMVRSTDGSHLLIISEGREMMATMGDAPVALVNSLVDAEVRLRGVGVVAMDEHGRIQGMNLLVPSLDQVEVVEPPCDPAQLPVRTIGSLLSQSGPRESIHRVKLEGVVTLQANQKVFLQDDTGSALAISKENVVLDARFGHARWLYWRSTHTPPVSPSDATFYPGERVQVVGFPETYRYSPVLTGVTLTRLGGRGTVKPVELTANGLEKGGQDSSLITLAGVLRSQTTIGANSILAVEWQDRTLQVFVPGRVEDLLDIALGSRVQVTGVCQVDPAPYPELGLGVGAVRIQSRSPADVQVLARPSWWTVERALMVMGGMAFVTLAALMWIKALRRQVEERTVQLSAEIQLRERTERHHALEQERARIAKDLHDDLGANLTQIVFLSERVEVARHDGQDVTRWFDLIPATARRTIQSLDEIVWAINPRHDSLESLANYLSQFAQEHLTLAGVRCVLDVPMVLPAVPLTAEIRHNLLLTTREALQNAVTHASASEVRLTLNLNDDGLSIAIADNGKGFDPANVSREGNGLPNMRRRLQSIGGRLEITSRSGRGSVVRLLVPPDLLHGRVIGNHAVSRHDA